jgi:hypothetical protein
MNSTLHPAADALKRSIKMKTTLILLVAMILLPFAHAESTGIGISVKLDKENVPIVTIISGFKEFNAANVTVAEAAKRIAAFRIKGSTHWVGIVIDDSNVELAQYLPLLDAISKNPVLELFFVDADPTEDNYVSKNIQRRIEQGGGGNALKSTIHPPNAPTKTRATP